MRSPARYPVALEIRSGRADFLVELRGFEPMAIAGAARSRGGAPLEGFARPLKAALGGGLSFRLAASRFWGRGKDLRRDLSLGSRRRKEPNASAENTGIPRRRHPEELPIDPLENTIRRLRSSAGMRKYRSFTGGSRTGQVDPKHAFPTWTLYGRSAPESCRRR
jgi:hypothetical protein